MKHQWQVRRSTVAVTHGQQRWDHAYQLLMRWTTTSVLEQGPTVPPARIPPQEVYRACSSVCPRLDDPAGAATDD